MTWMLLLRLLPRDLRDNIAGDLHEEFLRIYSARGRWRAAVWGWACGTRVVAAFAWERFRHRRGVPPIGEELRAKASFWDSLRQDTRFSIRLLRQQPAFTAVAVGAMVVGIGGNTAMFSIVDAVLWRALPYADADRVMQLAEQRPKEGRTFGAVSPADFFDWRSQSRSFASMAAYYETALNLTRAGEPERIPALMITSGFLEALGIMPASGRGFTVDEETIGHNRLVVLTDRVWRRRFGSDPAIVGGRVMLDDNPYTVVGVLPRTFWWPEDVDVLVPLALTDEDRALRGAHFFKVLGRLQRGVVIDQAQQELALIGSRLEKAYPEANLGHSPNIRPMREALVGQMRLALLALLAACGFVLLIGCANVATLLLARATRRQKELAIRRAVGATRGRIARQMIIESLAVSICGGALGVLVAGWAVAAVRLSLHNQFADLPGLDRVGVDGHVLAVAAAASIITGLVFGLLPAVAASDARIGAGLGDDVRSSTANVAARRMRSALVATEMAVSLILLAGAALMIASFYQLSRVSPGFRTDRLLLAEIDLPSSRYGEHALAVRFYESVMERVHAAAGVERVAVTSAAPFTGFDARLDLDIEQPTVELKPPVRAQARLVSDGYFAAMGVPLLRGRAFTERDTDIRPRVAIINQAAVRRFWPNADPIGHRISLGSPTRWMEVVGLVGDVRHEALSADSEPEAYIPFRQGFDSLGSGLERGMTLVVRAPADAQAMASVIRIAVKEVDSEQPIGRVRTMDGLVAASVHPQRLNYLMASAFAFVAVVLTAAGLYGVMSYVVAQRTREIGVRMALGASSGRVLRMVIGEAGIITAIGIAGGLAGSLVVMRFLRSMLFGVSAGDPVIYIAASGLLAAIALAAAVVPSRRATHIDPVMALRDS
jgi:putative ABC transport system permease protein